MRKLTTSLSLLTLLAPFSAFAQEAVSLDEIPEENAAPAAAEAPAADAAEETPAAEEAPAEEAAPAEPVALEESGAGAEGGAALSADTTAGFQASGTTAAAPAAPAATEPAAPPKPANRPTSTRGGEGGDGSWEFSYSGYFRAPMRIGISDNTGPQHIAEAGTDADGNLVNPEGLVVTHNELNEIDGFQEKRMTLHRPVIPDDQYASWQFTGVNANEWAEMFFTVGNGTVSGTLAVQGFQFTDSTWKDGISQFGIGQGWLEVNHDLGFENIKFNAKIGSHWARYGMAGIYDAGEYDTYLIGRTHTMGVTSRVDVVLPSFDLGFEGGFGVKQPDPEMFNRARFTTLAHGHVFLTLPQFEFGLHAMHAWSAQEVVPTYPGYLPGSGGCSNDAPGAQCTINDDQINRPDGTELHGGAGGISGDMSVWGPEYPVGKQTVLGFDARMDFGLLGYLYAGYSYQMLKNALTVDNAIESIHSLGAGNFALGVVDNYLESPFCRAGDAPNESCSNGTGSVGTALLQYELGLANFGVLPGDMDLKTKLFGMFNHVSVDDIEQQRLADQYQVVAMNDPATLEKMRQDGITKMKFGFDMEFFPLDWMSAGLRFDRLNPTSNELVKAYQGFMILSPRVTLRTAMVTHEEITLQYSRYIYDERMCQDDAGNVASPADDQFRPGSVYGGVRQEQQADGTFASTGLPLNQFCVQPSPSPPSSAGFGQHSNGQTPGNRGAPNLLPDENVIKLSASMWW